MITERNSTASLDQLQRTGWARKNLSIWLMLVGSLALIGSVPMMQFDHRLSQGARVGHVPGDLRKAIELSEAFAHGSGAAVILITLLLATTPPRRNYWIAVCTTASSGVLANILKAFFTRARPYTYDDVEAHVSDVSGWEFLGSGSFWDAQHRSFPSGHTATAWGLAIGLSLMVPRATAVFIALACLATFQRIYSGAHFPSDTLAGFGIACLVSSLILWLFHRTDRTRCLV